MKNKNEKFNFIPYHYGPYDKQVYLELSNLSLSGKIDIRLNKKNGYRLYKLSQSIIPEARKSLEETFGDTEITNIRKLNDFVISKGFNELISSIYEKFPEMEENSIFKRVSQ